MYTCTCGTVVHGATCPECRRSGGRSYASVVLLGLMACAGGAPDVADVPPEPEAAPASPEPVEPEADTPPAAPEVAEPMGTIYGSPEMMRDDPPEPPREALEPDTRVKPKPVRTKRPQADRPPRTEGALIYGSPSTDLLDEEVISD